MERRINNCYTKIDKQTINQKSSRKTEDQGDIILVHKKKKFLYLKNILSPK